MTDSKPDPLDPNEPGLLFRVANSDPRVFQYNVPDVVGRISPLKIVHEGFFVDHAPRLHVTFGASNEGAKLRIDSHLTPIELDEIGHALIMYSRERANAGFAKPEPPSGEGLSAMCVLDLTPRSTGALHMLRRHYNMNRSRAQIVEDALVAHHLATIERKMQPTPGIYGRDDMGPAAAGRITSFSGQNTIKHDAASLKLPDGDKPVPDPGETMEVKWQSADERVLRAGQRIGIERFPHDTYVIFVGRTYRIENGLATEMQDPPAGFLRFSFPADKVRDALIDPAMDMKRCPDAKAIHDTVSKKAELHTDMMSRYDEKASSAIESEAVPLKTGDIVRLKGGPTTNNPQMTVIETNPKSIKCGWFNKDGFHAAPFPPDALVKFSEE
jgi:uncharacterized protein YodC (DUF2158 family)